MSQLIKKFDSGGTSPTSTEEELKRQALQNSNHDNWRDAYAEYSGKNGSWKDKREFRKAWKSGENVRERVGAETYDQLRRQEELEQFGTQGFGSGSEGEQTRFNRRFNRRLRNGKLNLPTAPTPAAPAAPVSQDQNSVIYPWNWDTYQIRPRGGLFSQSFMRTSYFPEAGAGVSAGAGNNPELKPKTDWNAIAAQKLGERKTMQDVIALQKQLGITADGKWGKQTQAAYDAYLQNQPSYRIYKPAVQIDDKSYQPQANSSDVANIQRNLGLPVTGVWDDSTTEAVKTWQLNNGLEQTGIWYQATTNAYDAFQKDKEIQRQSQLRTRFGFADENAVKEWQLANGLEGTGQLDQSSIGKWNELSRPKAGSNTQPNPFVGEKSYMTEQDARYAFANLYNKHLGDKGLSRTDYFSNVGYSNATKELEGYDEAWNQFISQYDNHGYPGIFGKRYTLKEKLGGKMNRINYFQQGGAAPQQQNMQQQVMQLVQAAMQGDKKATQTIQQVIQAAEQGDQQAQQIAQMIQQVMEQVKGQAVSAKWGSKLGYIKSLKYAKGGKTCPSCENGGKPLQTPSVKKPIKKIEEKACGGKTKKR